MWAGARTSMTIAFFVALIEAVVGITVGVLWGYVRQLDFFFTELYNICDNVPSTIILILISYVAEGHEEGDGQAGACAGPDACPQVLSDGVGTPDEAMCPPPSSSS